MLISRDREKLINTIVFFARNTAYCGKTKLFKLVQEWAPFEPDLAAAIDVVPERVIDYDRLRIEPMAPFDDSHFTKRELRLMDELAERHRDDMTPLLIGLTHEERGPWDKIWDGGRGNDARIPYALAIPDDDPNRNAVLKAASEYDAIVEADSLLPR